MKNKNFLMMLLVGALISSTIFSGCKKDDDKDDDNVQDCKVYKSISMWGGTAIFEYDEQGRLTTAKDVFGNIRATVTYINNQVEFNDVSLIKDNSAFNTITYNSNNQPVQLINEDYFITRTFNAIYNSTGQLQEVNYVQVSQNSILNGSGSYTNIVYSEGNIMSLQNTFINDGTGNSYTENFVYTYYDKENFPPSDPAIIFYPFELRGEGITSFSKHRIKSYEMLRSNGDTESFNSTYHYDADGKVVKASSVLININGDTSESEVVLEYVCN